MFELTPGEFVAARDLLDTAPDAIVVVGPDARIVYVNRQTEALFGYARAELLEQPLDVLVPKRFRAAHGADVARFFAAPTVRSMGSGFDLFGARRDGTELPIEVSLSPLQGVGGTFVSAAIRDVSERKRSEAALRLSSGRLSSAVESIADSLALFDAEDRLFLCNASYRQIFGDSVTGPLAGRTYPEVLQLAMSVLRFDSADEQEAFRAARLAERKSPGPPYEIRTASGRHFRVTNRRTPEGGVVQTVADITEDTERAEELRRARIAAEAGSAAKSEFLASMSHELRTPLNAILGFAQLCQRDKKEPLSDRHQRRVEQILKGGEHLLRLIDDILDLARIEAGGVTISVEPVDARQVIEEVVQTLEPAVARAGLSLQLSADDDSSWMVRADRTRLAQILMNFGSNAIKYNRAGGSVSISLQSAGSERVRIIVQDTGIGIPVDKRHMLFTPFQRAGQETGTIEGTGIGLVISKRLAELMDGAVGYRGLEHGGSEFWVEVARMPASLQDDALRTARHRASDRLVGQVRGVVLYVEDNPANVVFMGDLLDAFDGVELLVAATAEAGIALAETAQPTVIVMDLNLPGMSGLDALRVLRATPSTATIPVIALTAAATERDRRAGEQAGFYRYLTKPVQVDELERVLDALLQPAS